jgi:CHAT domain/Cytosol aminopeptidase family, N-terminal domain
MARNRAATGGRPAAVASASSDKRKAPASGQTGTSATEGIRKIPIAPAPGSAAMPAVLRETPSAPIAEASVQARASTEVAVEVTLIRGGHAGVKAPVAVGARYEGLALAGAAKVFDRLLDSWLTRAIDMGMIGSGLGQLFPINLQRLREAGKVKVGYLLLVGMGEPGRFAADDLRFLMSNVTVAVKSMGHDELTASLFGTRRNELSISEAVRGFISGILDGYERFRAIVDVVRDGQERLRQAARNPLLVSLVEADEKKLQQVWEEFQTFRDENSIPGLKLKVVRGDDVDPDPTPDFGAADTEQDVPVTFLRVTRKAPVVPDVPPPAPVAVMGLTESFEFSALSELAAVAVREEEVNAYLVRALPDRLITTASPELGRFFANLVIPEDFRKLTESAANLTLEVDETTAMYPWEMMAHKKYATAKTSFLGTSIGVSRQFRSLLSPPPSSPPPLNTSLQVLVIADPAPDHLSLPFAREEGFSVLQVLDQARRAWQGQYEIKATVRIGSHTDAALDPRLEELRKQSDWIVNVDRCNPLDIAMLIVDQPYDVIHYAGHGFFDAKAGRAGWVLDKDCSLSAQEIFRVRQVPRLVFANACFSAVTADGSEEPVGYGEQRKRLVGVARAFFARGIPNFIGTGWKVDDASARECARWFYARVLGLSRPDGDNAIIDAPRPATISASLLAARRNVFQFKQASSTWGAYQHYGRVSDKLLPPPNARTTRPAGDGPQHEPAVSASANTGASQPSVVVPASPAAPVNPGSSMSGVTQMSTNTTVAGAATTPADQDLIYVNGIDFDTGTYAIPPRSVEEWAKDVRRSPGLAPVAALHGETPRSFGLPFGVDFDKLEDAGWGIVFHEDTPQDIRGALDSLIAARSNQAKPRFKALNYKKGEQTRDWYQRNGISAGNVDPEIVPYYLLLVGPPNLIPFEFQYLLGIEYAVGRLAFDTAAEYASYARSILAYEAGSSVPNAKEIVYWGTRHLGDPATNLSASLLVDPLANGMAGAAGALKRPIGAEVGYGQKLFLGDAATKEALLTRLHAGRPPALLFTASHGMSVQSGRPNQGTDQGALLCQDWPGFGSVRPQHFLAAADVADDANVNGLVALVFACFGAGTPDADQFLMNLSQAGKAPPLAPQPFIAALPRRLLAHPNGSALAVIGHIDRAWGFSIQAPKTATPQIGPFRNSLGFILSGNPVGHALAQQFGARFAELSAMLLSAVSPTAPTAMRPSDRDLVTYWLERNDAQNYVLLGDPAARIRENVLS